MRTMNGRVTKASARKTEARVFGDVDAQRALRPVERQQHEAGDDRRQRERDVDDDVEDALAPEPVADQHPGDDACPSRC